jgi:hypothetical protein
MSNLETHNLDESPESNSFKNVFLSETFNKNIQDLEEKDLSNIKLNSFEDREPINYPQIVEQKFVDLPLPITSQNDNKPFLVIEDKGEKKD